MPKKPQKPCGHLGCPSLTDNRYCKEHGRIYEKERGSAVERGYDSRWRKARVRFLKVHPLCVKCKEEDKLVKATVVDHIVPHRGDKKLFWDESNWQALCKKCHDRKTRNKDQYQEYTY
ncbi:HNH endonuclease [Halalkalibacterium halodurans]|uniref:HNH endonuclease n=1 Tax=Halalkalibacterium halodurans TaxID=86665 RepID=UPI001068B28E|nr:HNH endonuclease signature motif containing protein [Halalkalibacterium halodurans]TES51699.1 HNH endonuclease [Halalkalibacterium halodurans]